MRAKIYQIGWKNLYSSIKTYLTSKIKVINTISLRFFFYLAIFYITRFRYLTKFLLLLIKFFLNMILLNIIIQIVNIYGHQSINIYQLIKKF